VGLQNNSVFAGQLDYGNDYTWKLSF
jgi:hypothetical protein